MNRKKAKQLHEQIQSLISEFADDQGFSFESRCSFSSTECKLTLSFSDKDESGIPADFKRNAPMIGLSPDDYGKEFQSRGKTFRITGINLRRRKYPVSAVEVASGKQYKFGADYIKYSFGSA